MIADFFSESQEACTTAFAATAFFNGYAGAVAYFIFLKLPRQGEMEIFSKFLFLFLFDVFFRDVSRQKCSGYWTEMLLRNILTTLFIPILNIT